MKTRLALAAVLLAGVAILGYLAFSSRPAQRVAPGAEGVPTLRDVSAVAPGTSVSAPRGFPPGVAAASLDPILAALAEECRGDRNRTRLLGLTARLKKRVHALPPDEAAAFLAQWLRSGVDYETGLSFVVGSEGILEEAPTLRTVLLDLLGQTDPALSADLSREVLRATDSADEYALALRNLAWINSDRRLDAELLAWFRGLLGRPQWRAEPSDGFLEAFDAAVDLAAAAEMAGVLASTAPDPSSPVDRAAFIALDRIMITEPPEVLGPFGRDPAFLAASPMHRASLLSRLDVRDPRQQEMLADYVLRFPHAAGELEYFTRIFPNGHRFVGHRLITPPEPVPSIAEIEELDRATIALLETWAGDARFTSRAEHLRAMVERLRTGRPTSR